MAVYTPSWRRLNIGVVGGGIGGLATALSLRRAGHTVTIYERTYYTRDAGASISCPANGTKWLKEWGVDISRGNPIWIQKQIRRKLETGQVEDILDLANYKEKWGHEYYNFYRIDMHTMLLEAATGPGDGEPALLLMNHDCRSLDFEKGVITFKNGVSVQHDLIVGADGVGSSVRQFLGITPQRKQATSTCYHCVIKTSDVYKLGLPEMACSDSLQYWGDGLHKIVYSACRGGHIQSFFIFFPLTSEEIEQGVETWDSRGTYEQVLRPFPNLDPKLRILIAHADNVSPWRLYEHSPYPQWQKGQVCLLGDAAHPMLPDQSQGACQALEDAAALGIIFSRDYAFSLDIKAGLQFYELIRKPRASKVQAASARARRNLSERIGFSSQKTSKLYSVADESKKLTIEEINGYCMRAHVALEAPVEYRSWKCMETEHLFRGESKDSH